MDILPDRIANAVKLIDNSKLYEIRLRVNKPITVNIQNRYHYLTDSGLASNLENAITPTTETINTIFYNACEHSKYAVNDELKQGYITLNGGYRLGICGEMVYENNEISTIKNISSLNIRIPHEVKGCAKIAFEYCLTNTFENTLIISPPGAGKTTVLRDLARLISHNLIVYNIVVIDERNEISNTIDGVNVFNVGNFTDVLCNCKKKFGFNTAIRTLKPDIIFTDEIGSADDIDAIIKASTCGIKIAATVHATSIESLKKKEDFKKVIEDKLFTRYIVLSTRKGVGTYEAIYDENFRLLYKEIWLSLF